MEEVREGRTEEREEFLTGFCLIWLVLGRRSRGGGRGRGEDVYTPVEGSPVNESREAGGMNCPAPPW
jgi:hypothetical protein